MSSGKGQGCGSGGRRGPQGRMGGGWMGYLKAFNREKTPPVLKKEL